MTLINQVRLVSAVFLVEGILLFFGFDTGGSRSFVEATPKSAAFFFSIGLIVLFFSEYLKQSKS
jgi:hypothetical protein